MKRVRVRYAPSPTGHLHIGGARSALFNYLFAKNMGGDFVFRLEDTDIERNIEGGEASQLNNLIWLGIVPDESPVNPNPKYAPYRQMERLDIYRKYVDELIEKGFAYKCFCTAEELGEERERQESLGLAPMYNRKCLHLTQEEILEKEKAALPYVVRVRVPENETYEFEDIIRGTVKFESEDIGDWVILKSNGIPTYNFAVVIDDYTMEISHVFRGEEHLSNTPKQMMIYRFMGWEHPQFGHMTLIVNEQRKKLSKRDETIMQFVSQYKEEGYLPEAMFNFLALLGWSPEGEEEIFHHDELIEMFNVKRLSKSPSMFDKAKLAWVNNRYIKEMSSEAVVELCTPFLEEAYDCSSKSVEWIETLIGLYQGQMSYGKEIVALSSLFFKTDFTFDEESTEVLGWETTPVVKEAFKTQVENAESFDEASIKAMIKAVQKETGIKGKPLFMGIRVLVSAQSHGPDLTKTIELLGKEAVLLRLQ